MHTATTNYAFSQNIALAFIALFLFTSTSLRAQTSPFAGGSGTKAYPYQVATAAQLDSVRHYSNSENAYFIQTADIDLNVAPYNTGLGWLPIEHFRGYFDGNGHTIYNLFINDPDNKSLPETVNGGSDGLIRDFSSGRLLNITLVNPSVTGGAEVGALVANIRDVGALRSVVESCRVIGGSVSGNGYVGGMIGKTTGGIDELGSVSSPFIFFSYVVGATVSQRSTTGGSTGGLIGMTDLAEISASYTNNTVDGGTNNNSSAGGLVGEARQGIYIEESYSASRVTGSGKVDGIIGDTLSMSTPTLLSVAISPPGRALDLQSVYYNKDSVSVTTPNTDYTLRGTPLITAQMRQRASFTNWSFASIWFIEEGVGFPYLLERKADKLVITGDEGWRMLASPYTGKSIDELFGPLWTQGFTGTDSPGGASNVYFWDEKTKTWTVPTAASTKLSLGTGFLVYVYADDNFDGTPEGFPKLLSFNGSNRVDSWRVHLDYTRSDTAANDGWNLVGNPFATTINWKASQGFTRTHMDSIAYIWSDSAGNGKGAYLSWSTTGVGTSGYGKIAPWQGFWVQANATGSQILFDPKGFSSGGVLHKQAKPMIPKIDMKLEGNGFSSRSVVMFHEQAEVGKDPLDAYKLHSLNPDYLLLGTSVDGRQAMDIQTLPLWSELEELELVIEGSDLNGEFTLNWAPKHLPEGSVAELVDTKTGKRFPLTKAGSYTFSLNEGKAKKKENRNKIGPPASPITPVIKSKKGPARFVIRFNMAVSNNQDPYLPTKLVLEQNYPNPFNPVTTISYLIPTQSSVRLEVFDMLGRKVATLVNENQAAGAYSIPFDASNLASGVYIYRLEVAGKSLTKKLTLIK